MAEQKQMEMGEATATSDEPPEKDVREDEGKVIPYENKAGVTEREDFGGIETAFQAETASAAVAEQARASVEARYVMALKRPRDWDVARQRILKECRRPSFAKVARYRKPIGKGIEGLSIRFVEMALRNMGNVLIETPAIFDDARRRTVRVSVTDLETNTVFWKDIIIEKTVERRKPADDGSYISVRKNTYGDNVFLVPATEDDLLNKEGALVSKAIRTQGLRVIPGDIQAEAESLIKKTVLDETARDPDSARKEVLDGFAALNIPPSELSKYLGHDLGIATPAEIAELRTVWTALKDGEASWSDALEAKGRTATPESGQSKTERLKSKLGKIEEKTATA
jgi:hypothetical protein